ncbi:MAG: hypothetical protein OXG47_06635 [bacterium]|nr:hypothetical protein [bacterium]
MSGSRDAPAERSARPGRRARAAATAAILLAGACGGLIGYALVDVSCSGDCGWQLGVGTLTGAVVCAAGVAIVASLTLRAMSEWREAPRGARSPLAPRRSRRLR